MRQLLRLIGNRYGISLGLVVVVVAIVVVAKALGGGGGSGTAVHGDPVPAGPVATSFEPDDGEASPAAPLPPSTSPGAPAPTKVAADFTQAWLRHDGVSAEQWLAGLSPYATKNLHDQLTGVDPAGVPAARVTGDAALVPHDSTYAVVAIPVDSGLLTLRLLASNGRWLVDGVDWSRA
jgi:hypothetical protein